MLNKSIRQQASLFSTARYFFATGVSYTDPKNPRVFMQVSRDGQPLGRMVFELYKNHNPKTVENFRSLCAGDNKQGYTYKKSHFHRIIGGFMAHSMANAGPNTNGSQFFITFAPTDWLDGYHCVFGELVEGDNILRQLELAGTRSGTPTAKIVIDDCGEIKNEAEAAK